MKIITQVSAAPSEDGAPIIAYVHRPKADHQMAELELPSKDSLQEIGRAVIRYAQLEHLLKVVYKRTEQDMPLAAVLKLKFSLGSLLNGATEWGERKIFAGLIKVAEKNTRLHSILDQLKQAQGLCTTRNKYAHNGIGKGTDKKFFFLATGEKMEETSLIKELSDASKLIEDLLSEINKKIPPA